MKVGGLLWPLGFSEEDEFDHRGATKSGYRGVESYRVDVREDAQQRLGEGRLKQATRIQ